MIDRRVQRGDPADTQHRVVLPSEGRLRTVLALGGGPHRDLVADAAEVLVEVVGTAARPCVADDEGRRYRQSHGRHSRQPVGLAAHGGIGDLVQTEDVATHVRLIPTFRCRTGCSSSGPTGHPRP